MDSSVNTKKLIRYSLGLILVLVVGLGAYSFIGNLHFKIKSINPGINQVATVSPFIKVTFNKPLAAKKILMSSSYSVAKSYQVNGKVLTVSLDIPMTAGYQYYIKLQHITDTQGDVLPDKTFVFTPKYVDSHDLPADQQAALLQAQLKKTRTKDDIVFAGVDDLVNYGVTSEQVESLKQYFFDYKPKTYDVSLVNGSTVVAPHDRNSASTTESLSFSVKIDNSQYEAVVTYDDFGSSVELVLSQQGSQVYDSGPVTSQIGE